MDRDKLAAQLGFKRSDIDMLMGIFMKNVMTLLEKMNGMIQENNLQGIIDTAHAIKGSAGNLKLDEIANLAKEIEIMAITKSNESYEIPYNKLKKIIELLAQSE